MLHPSVHRPLHLQLWFGDVHVADLRDALPHQGTWFAEYSQVVAPDDGTLQSELREFIAFGEEWNRRLHRGEDPDATEFDRFDDIIESESWRVLSPDDTELRMTGAPNFVGNELSWNHPKVEPSAEIAANREWTRLTAREWPP